MVPTRFEREVNQKRRARKENRAAPVRDMRLEVTRVREKEYWRTHHNRIYGNPVQIILYVHKFCTKEIGRALTRKETRADGGRN